MPYKKTPDMTSTRVKVAVNHLDWLMLELGAPSHADLLAGLVHFATTPAGKAAVRASGLIPQRRMPTPPVAAKVTEYVAEGGVYVYPRAVVRREPKPAPRRVELTDEELDALLAD